MSRKIAKLVAGLGVIGIGIGAIRWLLSCQAFSEPQLRGLAVGLIGIGGAAFALTRLVARRSRLRRAPPTGG